MIARSVETLRWGIIGCGDVAEHKSGPPLYQTPGSELIAVMRRDKAKAAAFARRHGAKRSYADIDSLLADREVNSGLRCFPSPPAPRTRDSSRASRENRAL